MTDPFAQSVTLWIDQLKTGDEEAAARLWDRCFPQLLAAARRKMGNASRRIADEEDVAIDVFNSLCIGAREGRFEQLSNRSDLWKLLVAIAGKKVVDQIRRQTAQKRGGVNLRGESIVADRTDPEGGAGLDQFASAAPTPAFLAIIEEQQRALFSLLRNDQLRLIAKLRLEGCGNEEIAEEVGISLRSVERKLSLIRETWTDAIGHGGSDE